VHQARERVRGIYGMVEAGRNLRAEARVPSNRNAKFALRSGEEWLRDENATVARLLNAESIAIKADFSAPAGASVTATRLGELFLLRNESDRAAEIERLSKEMAKLENDLRATETKLANPAFTERAPAAVVDEHRRRQRDLQTRLKQLREARESLV